MWSIWKDLECPGRLYSWHACAGLYYVNGFGRADLNDEWGHILHRGSWTVLHRVNGALPYIHLFLSVDAMWSSSLAAAKSSTQ